jgi:hypothetical protein
LTTRRSSTPSTPAARRWSPYTARSRRDAATGGGEADDFLAGGCSSTSPARTRVASSPQSAAISNPTRRTLIARRSADPAIRLSSGDSDSAAGGRSGRDRGVGDRRHSRPARPDRRAARAGAQRRCRTAPQAREQLSSGTVAGLSVLDLLGGLKRRKSNHAALELTCDCSGIPEQSGLRVSTRSLLSAIAATRARVASKSRRPASAAVPRPAPSPRSRCPRRLTFQPSSLPQLWIRVKVVPHRPGSANSESASRRSEASSSSLSVSSRRDSSATLN